LHQLSGLSKPDLTIHCVFRNYDSICDGSNTKIYLIIAINAK